LEFLSGIRKGVNMARVLFGTFAASVVALTLCGCSKGPPPIVPVEGVVLLDNKPLPHARVRFAPALEGEGGDYLAEGITDENGRFELTCKGQSGACACKNRVIVIEGPMSAKGRGISEAAQTEAAKYLAGLKNRPIPPVYATASKTPLSVTVTAGQTEYKLELKR
jgi:hypothetical protein